MPKPIRPRTWRNEHGQETIRLDVQAGVPIIGLRHAVLPPGIGSGMTEPWLYPFVWFACEHPSRAVDEACRFDNRCPACREDWARRELAGEVPALLLPKVPADAPRFREFGDGVDGQQAPAKLWRPGT
jgi:hypothetical protein